MNREERPIEAMVLLGVSVGCLMGCSRSIFSRIGVVSARQTHVAFSVRHLSTEQELQSGTHASFGLCRAGLLCRPDGWPLVLLWESF